MKLAIPRMAGDPPADFVEGMRLMSEAIKAWCADMDHPRPRFAIPPVGVGIVVALKYVWPVVCQNPAARELFATFQEIGRAVGGNARDPTLTMLTVALASSGLEPYEFRPASDFLDCANKLAALNLQPRGT